MHIDVLLCMRNCSSAEIKGKMAMAMCVGCLRVKEHFSSLKVLSTFDAQCSSRAEPDGTLSKFVSAKHVRSSATPASIKCLFVALSLQSGKPMDQQMASTSLWETTCTKNAAKTQLELGEVQKSLLHPPFSNVSAQEQAHPDSALNLSSGEQYVVKPVAIHLGGKLCPRRVFNACIVTF